jgi:hypothetical protein
MTIDSTLHILTKAEFDKKLADLLGQLEGNIPTPYYDNATAPLASVARNPL